jgi:DNA-binding protein WhiA
MSFCYDVKNEVCSKKLGKHCCEHAELLGMLLFARRFGREGCTFETEHIDVCERFERLSRHCLKYEPTVIVSRGHLFSAELPAEACAKIADKFGLQGGVIPQAAVEKDCCSAAFVRGAFLSAGSLVDPNKYYHLEFVCEKGALARQLYALMMSLHFAPKISDRDNSTVIYFKESEQIEDILTYVGAVNSSLELMNVKVIKDVRNQVNRKANFEDANYFKTYTAANRQCEAIEKLRAAGALSGLSGGLQTAASARMERPDATLAELAEDCGCSRSGLNHRLNKLIELAEQL